MTIREQPRYCSRCDRIDVADRFRLKLWDEEPCTPQNCSVWKVVGISRGGGPLLRLVAGDGDEG